MAKYSLLEAPRVYRARAREILAQKSKTEVTAARYLEAKVRSRIPFNQGDLFRTLVRNKNHVKVGGTDGFPYVHWINQTKGFGMRTLKYPRGAWIPAHKSRTGKAMRILPPGSIAVYGQTPNWRWSGQAGFFDKSVADTKAKLPEFTRKFIKDAWSLSSR